MGSYYLDSSALVKVHLPELGSGWVQQLVNATDAQGRYLHSIYSVTVSVVEVSAAIGAKEVRTAAEEAARRLRGR